MPDMDGIRHRIMIVGAPRSGTTLLQQVLSGHPDVHTLPETHYFQFMLRADFRRLLDRMIVRKSRFDAFATFVTSNSILDIPANRYSSWNTRRVVDFFVDMMDRCARVAGRSGWAEKTPGHLFYIDEIERYRGDLKFVHVLRRPEEVVASLLRVGRKHPDRWPGFDSVNRCIDLVESSIAEIARQQGRRNHALVCFERLLATPGTVTGDLLNTIGLDADADTVTAMLSGLSVYGVSRSDETWKTGYGDSIDDNRGSGFLELFSGDEQKTVMQRLAGSIATYHQLTGN